MRLKSVIALIIIGLFGAGLAACGGGSVSSGGAGGAGGAGGTGATSSLVLQAPQTASADGFHTAPAEANRLAGTFAEFLISSALAQSGETVYLLDAGGNLVATGTTDGSGQVIFPVSSGKYTVCIGASEPTDPEAVCTTETIAVGENQVVVATLGTETVDNDDGTTSDVLVFTSAVAEKAEDNIVVFQDPDNANKTLVCHKAGPVKQFTISVGTPAARNGHLAHGDTLGACPEGTEGTDDPEMGDDASEDDDSGGGPPDGVAGPPEGVGNGNAG